MAAVFFMLVVGSGIGFYNTSVILAAATDELDSSVGAVSGATGLFFAIGGLSGFVFSRWMDSADIRWFFASGGVVGAAALFGLRWVTSVPGLYLFFALFGVGFGLAGLLPATTLVTRWFDRRRSVALSIASTGLSVGGIALTPVSAWLIDQRTLVGASPYLALIWLLGIVPIGLLLIRSRPSDMGLRPDGAPPITDNAPTIADNGLPIHGHVDQKEQLEQASPSSDDLKGITFEQARSTRFFAALCIAYAAIFFGQVGAIAQLFKMVQERTDTATASTALSTLALTSVLFRLIGGTVVLKVPTKAMIAILTLMQALGLVLVANATTATTLILTSAFFGVSIGNLLMLQPLLMAEAFGVLNYSRIYGFSQLAGTVGVAGGPLALGVLRDSYDYRTAFFTAAAASLTGFVFIVLAGPSARIQAMWE